MAAARHRRGPSPVMTAAPQTSPTLLHVFPSFKVGGAQVRFAQIANAFGRSFRHRIFAMDGQYDCRHRLAADLDVDVVDVAAAKGRTLRNASRFRRMLRTLRPHLLVTYNWGAIEWAIANWPALVRHVHIEDGFGPEEATRQLPRRVWTRRLVLRRSTVVLPSQTLMRLATGPWRLSPERVRYIPNGIDCAAFSGPATAPPPPWVGGDPVVGTVAALRPEKNLRRLVRAVAQVVPHVPCRLVIVGDGPERAGLEALAAELGMADRVLFTGYVPKPQACYRHFDVFALSSDTEQMPYTVIEAMASGLAVAATEVGDVPDMVARKNLPFVTPCTDDALAAALRALLENRYLRHQVGADNRDKARRDYDEGAMFAAYRALFLGDDNVGDTVAGSR